MTRLRTYNRRKKRRIARTDSRFVGYREADPLGDVIKMEQRRLLEFTQERIEGLAWAWGESSSTPIADIQTMREAIKRRIFGPVIPRVVTQAELDTLKKLAEKHG